MYGNTSTIICEYGADGQLKNVEVKTLEQRIVDLENRLEAAEQAIERLSGQVEQAEAKITHLTTYLNDTIEHNQLLDPYDRATQ